MTWPFGDLRRRHYGAMLVDPPWRFRTWSDAGRDRCPDGLAGEDVRHYATMTLAEIRALPVRDLAAPDSALFLWTIDPMLPEALALGRHWGFVYKTVAFTWAKPKEKQPSDDTIMLPIGAPGRWEIGLGYWTRGNPEQCLLFTRGKPKRLSASVRQLIVSPRREHSRKPDDARERIEALVAGPYAELFARESAPGWDTWGNETARFDEAAE